MSAAEPKTIDESVSNVLRRLRKPLRKAILTLVGTFIFIFFFYSSTDLCARFDGGVFFLRAFAAALDLTELSLSILPS